ncbi:MAG: ABC-type transporter, permease subunit [Chlamydiales bacterium]|nr:ABC-type transporter, permease subunit [Chlamydiales bacterium]
MILAAIINPYRNQTFCSFFIVFIKRLWAFLTGQLPIQNLAADELQILVLVGVTLSCSLVGVFLVLRKMTMLANSLSHTILLGIVIVYLASRYWLPPINSEGHNFLPSMQALLLAAILTAIMTTFCTQFITNTLGLQEDASIGLVFTSFFALGVILITLFTRNTHIGVEIIVGNADLVHIQDLYLAWMSAILNVCLFYIFFKEFQITSFDSAFAKALGLPVNFFHYLLMVQVSVSIVSSFRSVGVLLVLALIVAPALIARLFVFRLGYMLFLSCSIGIGCSIVGVALSRHILTNYNLPISTTGLIVCIFSVVYAIALLVSSMQGWLDMKMFPKIKNKLNHD